MRRMTKPRHILSSSGLAASLLTSLVVTVLGCGGDGTNPGTADMATTKTTLTLTGVPTGCPATETAADLYTSVVKNSCAIDGCHGTNGTSFTISAAADLNSKWVGIKSPLYTAVTMPFVTANSVNNSFIMYKLTGSQGNYGLQMPETGGPLSSAQLCKFVSWINSGAPAQ
jgi:hypothetical protein